MDCWKEFEEKYPDVFVYRKHFDWVTAQGKAYERYVNDLAECIYTANRFRNICALWSDKAQFSQYEACQMLMSGTGCDVNKYKKEIDKFSKSIGVRSEVEYILYDDDCLALIMSMHQNTEYVYQETELLDCTYVIFYPVDKYSFEELAVALGKGASQEFLEESIGDARHDYKTRPYIWKYEAEALLKVLSPEDKELLKEMVMKTSET